jgi:nitrate/nitrite transporter NarK
MACYGIVTRLENISDMSVLVGLHFYKLEMAQRIALAQGLAKKLNEAQERHQALDPVETTQETEALAKFPQRFLLWFLAFTWAFTFGSFIHLGYQGLYSLLLKFF